MSKSRRQLSFVQTSENTAKRGNECALYHAPHTPLSALMSWRNVEAQKLTLTDLHLTHQCLVCLLCRDDWQDGKKKDIKPRWEKGERRASLCVAILHLHCQKLPLVSKYHIYLFQCENVQYPTPLCQPPLCQRHYHFVYETLQPKYTHCCTCNSSLRNSQKCICPNPEVICLVGLVYMKKHGSGFNGTSPEAYFNRCFVPSHTALQNHKTWLENIRQCIWDRIQFENEMIPNNDVLHLHWKRVCWVLDLWAQADRNTIIPKPLSNYGWKVQDNTLAVDWDSDVNMDAVKERVDRRLRM